MYLFNTLPMQDLSYSVKSQRKGEKKQKHIKFNWRTKMSP